MIVLNEIETDADLKMVTADRMHKAINSDQPDGYKLQLYESVLPANHANATNGHG